MIHIEEKPPEFKPRSLHSTFVEKEVETLADKIAAARQVVMSMPINGCITGSSFLEGFDAEAWDSTPDIDIFVYSESDLIRAVNLAQYALMMEPGSGTPRSKDQETWKLNRLYEAGLNRKMGITTYKFFCDGVILNFTHKQTKIDGRWVPLTNCPSVLMSFDMSIVMMGYDIQSHVFFDLRPDNVPHNVAVPNPLRKQDCVMWTVSKWVRQFDRVIKYYNRGFDTRPMAHFYLAMIDECIEAGSLFDSDQAQGMFEEYSKEFLEKRAEIADWLEAHIDD